MGVREERHWQMVVPARTPSIVLFLVIIAAVSALLSVQGGGRFTFVIAVVPYLVLVILTWYLGWLIANYRKVVEILTDLFMRALFGGRRPVPRRRQSLLISIFAWMIFLLAAYALLPFRGATRDPFVDAILNFGRNDQTTESQQLSLPAFQVEQAITPPVIATAIGFAAAGIIALSVVIGAHAGKRALWRLTRQAQPETLALGEASPEAKEAIGFVQAAIEDLEGGRNIREVIIACYARMCALLASKGYQSKDTETAREFQNVTLKVLPISKEAVQSLTGLFEEARYSEHEITEDERNLALESLNTVRDELKSQVVGSASGVN